MQNEYETLTDALKAFCERNFENEPSSRMVAQKIYQVYGVKVSHALVVKVMRGEDSPTLRKVFKVRKYPGIRRRAWKGTPVQARRLDHWLRNDGYENLQEMVDEWIFDHEVYKDEM